MITLNTSQKKKLILYTRFQVHVPENLLLERFHVRRCVQQHGVPARRNDHLHVLQRADLIHAVLCEQSSARRSGDATRVAVQPLSALPLSVDEGDA